MSAPDLKCCPDCGTPLQKVKQSPNSMFNAEQFDAARAGDWFCETCPADQGMHYRYFWDRDLRAQLEAKPAAPAAAPLPRPWPNDLPFRALKVGEIGDHTPWQIVCPGGEVLEMNHNADDAVDEARAKWMVSTLNLATEDWSPFLKEDETPLQRLKREIADCHTIATMLSNERRAAAPLQQGAKEKIAPVQGYKAGIPWSLHLEAYDAYRKKYGEQPALIDLEGRGCRGGFGTSELDMFVPGWRDKVSEIAKLKAKIAELSAALANTRAAAPAAEGASDAG